MKTALDVCTRQDSKAIHICVQCFWLLYFELPFVGHVSCLNMTLNTEIKSKIAKRFIFLFTYCDSCILYYHLLVKSIV